MASHFSSIGFTAQTDSEIERLVMQAVKRGETLATPSGSYIRWAVDGGPQLWVQVDPPATIVGSDPHFAGRVRMRVGLTRRVIGAGETDLDGAFYAWADPSEDDPSHGAYPFVFHAPDFDVHHALDLPTVAEVQLAAFAHRLRAYRSEGDYLASQQGEPGFAAESFIPSGLFKVGGETTDPPQALAILTGRILSAATLTNPVTGARFHWAWINTYGGEVDVVADPEVLDGALVEGGVVRGTFWLSGLLLTTAQARRDEGVR